MNRYRPRLIDGEALAAICFCLVLTLLILALPLVLQGTLPGSPFALGK